MLRLFDSKQRLKYIFILVAMIIAVVSLLVSNSLIKKLAEEEREKIEVWADATRMMTSENPAVNMSLILKIIEGNNSIPVIVCDEKGSVLFDRNIKLPDQDKELFMKNTLEEFKSHHDPIVIDLGDGTLQYFYYDDSIILKRLLAYPYIQLSIVSIFVLIAFFALSSTKKAEQNKIWVGLSKETAHQLGTPISSLIAWMELLKSENIDPVVISEMNKDVKRLEMIAERFSKIGSNPKPDLVEIEKALNNAITYMSTRISDKVELQEPKIYPKTSILINESLFSWVIENLIKNAVDAMSGVGKITFSLEEKSKVILLDITDTGKGIAKSQFKMVFHPGYTTKKRGWGLGLSLVKRIIESYHNGKIYVLKSEHGVGTTFRMQLPKKVETS